MAVSKKIIKNSALTKVIVSSLTNLEAATIAGSKALLHATKKSKQSSTEGKRISKKRITLIKRRKAAATKSRNNPIAANKKALNIIDKELADTRKAAAKNKSARAVLFEELSGLRINCRRLIAYNKALTVTDKILNKPKKKIRKRKTR